VPDTNSWPEEPLVEREVTYTLEVGGHLVMVERVPARVNPETGEQFFSPKTVERLHQMFRDRPHPVRVVEIPVFDFAACPA
jgi:YgiT-type zinc finger domain-containing protein